MAVVAATTAAPRTTTEPTHEDAYGAGVATFEHLLGVQELDTAVDQLLHRRANLPELSELAALEARVATETASSAEIAGRLDVVRSAEEEAETHASQLEAKAAEIDASLYDGSVTSHKELESLQEEHAALKVRQAHFEEQAIEQMELAEPIEAELAGSTGRIEALGVDIAALRARIEVARAEIDVLVDSTRAERATAAAAIDGGLLAEYDALREQLGGVAVARLHGARCEGCHLEIPAADVAVLRKAPDDEVVTCPECFRMLVR